MIRKIPPSVTGQFPPLVLDYINHSEMLRPFVSDFPSKEAYEKIIARRTYSPENRKQLCLLLQKQYAGLLKSGQDEAVRKNLQLLAEENTFTVTTGHQLNIFTGPLYTIYKILGTIKLAEELSHSFPENHVVPVFWLASEDHDFEEISSLGLFGKTYAWPYPGKVEHMAAGRLSTRGLDTITQELRALNISPQLQQLFEDVYKGSNNLADATQKLYHELFRDYGLIVLQPDEAELKKLFIPYMQEDILRRTNESAVQHTISQLGSYKIQLNPRSINHFYLDAEGRRERILYDGTYLVQHTSLQFTEQEMKAEIENQPERFSPNAVMRPLYQEVLLPNLAYIGGPGEIAYWLELKQMFDVNNVSFPILHLRNSFILAGDKLWKQIEQSEIPLEDFFAEDAILIKSYLDKQHPHQLLEEEISEINAVLDKIASNVESVDKSKVAAWGKRINDQKAIFRRWQKDFVDMLKEKDQEQPGRLLKIKSALLPGGALAERKENLLSKVKNEPDEFISTIYKYIEVFNTSVCCLKI